jgi:hypothetical protein
MSLGIFATLLLHLIPQEPPGAADWACAEPLIAQNYSRRVVASELAKRIADECVRPYADMPARTPMAGESEEAAAVFETLEHDIYRNQRAIFVYEIEDRIEQARRRDSIPLD